MSKALDKAVELIDKMTSQNQDEVFEQMLVLEEEISPDERHKYDDLYEAWYVKSVR